MDGASSVMAVASLALQLVSSVKQLLGQKCDFWESVQEAPSRIAGLVGDLRIFSVLLGELQHDEEIYGPQEVTLLALESCRDKVNALHALLRPEGFGSSSKVIKKWISIKAVLRKDKIDQFRYILEGAQSTLMSAQLINLRRLSQRQLQYHETNRLQSENMGDINDVKKDLAGLRMEQSSGLVTTTTAAPSMTEHLEEVRSEIRKTAASIANPVIRAGCERGLFIGLERAFSPSPEAIASTKSSEPIPARYASGGRGNKKVRVVLSRETKKLETFFGSISFHTETANFCIEANLTGKSALSERYEYKTTFRLFPASWLINRGLEYSINLTFRSNYQGWHQCLNIMRAVSGDSLILYACGEDRNLELVRHLITTEQASVRDQGPNGVTPLHIAAYFRQPAICQYLLEHKSDQSALMKTWDNKLLSPAQMACTLSYDNFMAEHHNSKIFGSREDTLARFLRTDEGFDDPILEQIVMLGDGYQEVLIEVSSDEFSPDKHENVDWLCQQATVDFKTAQVLCGLDIPSVTSMIARCANLSPKQSITDTPHHVENITSLVMRSPVWFQLWRNRVSAAPGDLHALLRRELSVGRLKDEGWTYSTLQDLFVQEYTSNGTPDTSIYCGKCQANINLSRMVEWEEYVDSTKNGSFHGCQDHMHLIRGTTVTIHDGKPQGLGIPHHIDSSRTFTQEHKFRACRNRRTPIRGQNKRYQDDLQFWNYGVSIYYSFREYRTRELYDIYAETGLCPLCAGEATGPGPDHEAVDGAEDQAEDQAEEEAEEEAVMLAPF